MTRGPGIRLRAFLRSHRIRRLNPFRSALRRRYDALVASLPLSSPIFLPTDRVPLVEAVAGLSRVRTLYADQLDAVHRPRLRTLRQTHHGEERCFIIGNGPSINQMDLSLLAGETTFAVNGFFLKARELDWKPTFYVVEDHLVAEDRAESIRAFQASTKLFPAYLAYCFDEGQDTVFFDHRPRVSYPDGFDFSIDAARNTFTGCTVTFTCMQLAAYFGFRNIYLIGVDADYAIPNDVSREARYGVEILNMDTDDPNHFDPDYFGKGFRWHDPQVESMLAAYEVARRATEAQGQKIWNAGVGGRLDVFERINFESLFNRL